MKRADMIEELKRAVKYSGRFIIYIAMLYTVMAVAVHWLNAGSGRRVNADSGKGAGTTAARVSATGGDVRPASGDMDSLPVQDTAGYWVYLGRYSSSGNKWISRNFDLPGGASSGVDISGAALPGTPGRGQLIVTLTELFQWDEAPSLSKSGWRMGRITGMIPTSETVLVMSVRRLWQENYWALVRH